MTSESVIDWLLEANDPGVRFRTLTELLGKPPTDPEVRAARARIPTTGWACEILTERAPWGGWEDAGNLYTPKYGATTWKMLALADLGMDRTVPSFRRSIELWADGFTSRTGTLGALGSAQSHHCLAGNMARAMIRFGHADDPRVVATLQWLVETASPLGGWSCFGSGRNLDSWEGLGAFAAYPRARRTPGMEATVAKASEFFLQRELHGKAASTPPWLRFHYPVHYYYDLLVGLDLLTSLGYSEESRLEFALHHLAKRRRRDGRWNLDALHPDVGGPMEAWFARHPKRRPTPFGVEVPGRPSKMITLTALKIVQRTRGRAARTPTSASD